MDYGKAIRTVRGARGISQKELGKATKIDPSYISRIESGDRIPTLEGLEKIAKALCVPLYLLILLASEEKDLNGLPEKEANKIARELFGILLTCQEKKTNGRKK